MRHKAVGVDELFPCFIADDVSWEMPGMYYVAKGPGSITARTEDRKVVEQLKKELKYLRLFWSFGKREGDA